MRLYAGPNSISIQVFSGQVDDRVGVQLHVGTPSWSADYKLSKNLHRLASSREVRLAPIGIAASHRGQFQLVELAAAFGPALLRLTRFGVKGATLVAFAFVLPSLMMVLGLAALYLRYGSLAWMQGVLYGAGAAVIAIIARSAWKLARSTLGFKRLSWLLFLVTAGVTVWTEPEIAWLFIGAGIVAVAKMADRKAFPTVSMLGMTPWLFTGLAGPAPDGLLDRIFLYFCRARRFRFRKRTGDCSVPSRRRGQRIPLAQRAAVSRCRGGRHDHAWTSGHHRSVHWTPGRRSIGRLERRVGCVPLFVMVPAPYFARIAKNLRIAAFVEGVTAAAIAGAAIVLGCRPSRTCPPF